MAIYPLQGLSFHQWFAVHALGFAGYILGASTPPFRAAGCLAFLRGALLRSRGEINWGHLLSSDRIALYSEAFVTRPLKLAQRAPTQVCRGRAIYLQYPLSSCQMLLVFARGDALPTNLNLTQHVDRGSNACCSVPWSCYCSSSVPPNQRPTITTQRSTISLCL